MIHILIDFESIQPRHLEAWADADTRVTVFVGAHQHRIPFEIAAAMQSLGARGRYVKLHRAGKNLLDFHLAFHLGELIARDPEARYQIVSRDSGFDALIEDLQARGLAVERLCLEPGTDSGEPCRDVEPDPLSDTDP